MAWSVIDCAYWRNQLKFPKDSILSAEAKDLICRLLCDVEHRPGSGGADQIKAHPCFEEVAWDKLYEMYAAFKPEVNASFAPLFLPVIQLDPPPPRTGSGPSRKIKAVHPELLSFFPNIVTFESYKPVTVEGNRLEEVVMWIWFLQATQCPNKCGQFTNEFV